MFLPNTVCDGERAGSLPLAGLGGREAQVDHQTVQSASLWACPDCVTGSTSQTTPARPAGVLASGLEGISGALPAIGNEPGQILLPIVSAVLVGAQDMVLLLAFLV